jgi:hypothetical protein
MEDRSADDELKTAITSGDPKALEKTAFDIGNTILQEGVFPNDYFDGLIALLKDDRFLRLEGSWKLIRVFEENWSELSSEQRDRLLSMLEQSYQYFSDWMACFVISGILGEQYGDDRALNVLCRLKRSASEMPRSFVPHGLEHIAKQSPDAKLAMRALAELVEMQRDSSDVVRGEVEESLSRLQKGESKS